MISLYFEDFDSKEKFIEFLNNYNDGKDKESQIKYTDMTGVIISSVKVIVDVISYALIAFVSIYLISSIIYYNRYYYLYSSIRKNKKNRNT